MSIARTFLTAIPVAMVLLATAAPALAALPPQGTAASAPASTVTTVRVDVTVPIRGDEVDGDLLLTQSRDGDDLDIDWSFKGKINGEKSQASGKATATWTGSGYQATVTSIDSWNAPTTKPYAPQSASLNSVGGITFIAGLPFFTGRSLPDPYHMPSTLHLSDPATSVQDTLSSNDVEQAGRNVFSYLQSLAGRMLNLAMGR